MIHKSNVVPLTLALIALPGLAEPHIDDQNSLAMFTAMRETCAEIIPDKKDYFLKSRFTFESVHFHRLAPVRKDPGYLELLEKYRVELRQGLHAFDMKNCIGLAEGKGMLQLISIETSKPMLPINLSTP